MWKISRKILKNKQRNEFPKNRLYSEISEKVPTNYLVG